MRSISEAQYLLSQSQTIQIDKKRKPIQMRWVFPYETLAETKKSKASVKQNKNGTPP